MDSDREGFWRTLKACWSSDPKNLDQDRSNNISDATSKRRSDPSSPHKGISVPPDLMKWLQEPYRAKGQLLKLSSKGTWQKRYYQLHGPYLCYWSSEATVKNCNKISLPDPSASTDIRLVASCTLDTGPTPQIVLGCCDGTSIKLRALSKEEEINLKKWVTLLKTSMEKYPVGSKSRVGFDSNGQKAIRKRADISSESDIGSHLKKPYRAKGRLLKLSSKGIWQKRYYQLHGPYLCYWGSASMLKRSGTILLSNPSASTDLRLVSSCTLNAGPAPQILLECCDGTSMKLRALCKEEEANLKKWVTIMQSIIEGDDDGHVTTSTFGKHSAIVIKNSTDLLPDLQKELKKPYQARGQLLKLSSKGSWQKRYYELHGPYLCYWHSSTARDKLASTDLRSIESVMLRDSTIELTFFNGTIHLKAISLKEATSLGKWADALKNASLLYKTAPPSPSALSAEQNTFDISWMTVPSQQAEGGAYKVRASTILKQYQERRGQSSDSNTNSPASVPGDKVSDTESVTINNTRRSSVLEDWHDL